MRNPLNKRFGRELKQDFGKYLVIFLFQVMLISLVSGYLVTADSIEKTFYEGWDKYKVEDGHIIFTQEPSDEVLSSIEDKADLTFYDLQCFDETIDNTEVNLRVFKNRQEVNKVCLMDGQMPEEDDEIALDRLMASNNDIQIGDTISVANRKLKVTGIVALVDYNCLYENPTDTMFNAITFGVGIMTEQGYAAFDSSHISYEYAWRYKDTPANETEEDQRSEDLQDVLEDVIKDYDTSLVQAQVNDLYAQANTLSEQLENQFDDASDVLENKISDASEKAGTKAVNALSVTKKLELYMSGASAEDYMKAAAEEQGTSVEGLIAAELGCSEQALKDLEDAEDDMDSTVDSADISSEPPTISLDDEDDNYENEMDFSLDGVRDMVAKIEATGLYDVTEINATLDQLDELMNYKFNEDDYLKIDSYAARYENPAINFCIDDMASDKPTYIVFTYIVMILLAFIFAITISNTIASEAGAIGTLRASGYTRGELVRHYLFVPLMVSVVAAIIGNILGYTIFVDFYQKIFYNSFCLATYESFFNSEAFILTTVIPMIMMLLINLFMLTSKMKLSPIKFLRHDLKKKVKRRAMLLNKKIPFMHRFRLRILFQNIPAYAALAFGIIFGGMIAVFGWMFMPLLADYSKMITENKLSEYQYIVADQNETDTKDAEKFCLTSLDTMVEGYLTDEVSIYGIEEDSIYITEDIPEDQVLITDGMAEKFNLKEGDTLTLKKAYQDKTYDFTVGGVYQYDGAMCVFMNRSQYLDTFEEDSDYFTGYFTNEEITDIDQDDIVTTITGEDLADMAEQLMNSMGAIFAILQYFGMILFLLIMYLLTKQIIEKNMQSIAMTKILGYRDGEIARLYLLITSFVVLASLLVSIPLIDALLKIVFKKFIYTEMTGYIPYIVSNTCYVKEVALGIGCYLVVSLFMMRKIKKIEKSEALKNVE